jgi:hypothetical protein
MPLNSPLVLNGHYLFCFSIPYLDGQEPSGNNYMEDHRVCITTADVKYSRMLLAWNTTCIAYIQCNL